MLQMMASILVMYKGIGEPWAVCIPCLQKGAEPQLTAYACRPVHRRPGGQAAL